MSADEMISVFLPARVSPGGERPSVAAEAELLEAVRQKDAELAETLWQGSRALDQEDEERFAKADCSEGHVGSQNTPSRLITRPSTSRRPPLRRSATKSRCTIDWMVPPVSG